MTAAIVLLSVALSGQSQCGPRGCAAPRVTWDVPSDQGLRFAQPTAPPLREPQPARKFYVIKRHRIIHEGLRFEVEGYQEDSGRIRWEPTREFNRKSYEAAKARRQDESARHADKTDPNPVVGQDIQNFGLSPERMTERPDTYRAQSPEARQFIEEAKAPADKGQQYHVTVIGSPDSVAPVVNDLKSHPAFEGIRESLMVQDYLPGESGPLILRSAFQARERRPSSFRRPRARRTLAADESCSELRGTR